MSKLRCKENSIHDLEAKIMSAWQTVDDIELLYHASESQDEDERMNALLGLQVIAKARFEDLFRVFEQFVPVYYFGDGTTETYGEPSDDLDLTLDEAAEGLSNLSVFGSLNKANNERSDS